jgi:hypothetical protein
VVVPLITSELFGTSLSYNSLIYTMIASSIIGLLCWCGLLFRSRWLIVKGTDGECEPLVTDGEEMGVAETEALAQQS